MRNRLVVSALTAAAVLSIPALAEGGGRPLSASLSGANEVPSGSGDPDGSGSARVTVNSGRNEICWDIDVANVSTVILAHIHEAPAGSNGPVRIDFNGKLEGCRSVDRELLREVRAAPEGYYVNVHTDQFRAGAVRGQLSK